MDIGHAQKCQKLEKKSFKKHEIRKEDELSTYLAVSELNLANRSSGGIDLNLVGNFGKNLFEIQFEKYILISRFLTYL